MRIVKDAYVVLDYVLYDEDGDVIEATDDEGGRPIGFVHGYGTLVPGLESGLVGMAPGETKEIVVSPEEAYGPHDPELEHWVDKSDFPPDVALDDEFEAVDDDGEQITLRVVEVAEDALLVDANHPLAGETLRFEVMVRAVRSATDKELNDTRRTAPRPRLVLAGEPGRAPAEAPPSRTGPSSTSPAGERGHERGTQPPDKALRKDSPRPRASAELDDEQ